MYFYKLLPLDRKLMLDKVLRKKHIYFSFLIILILPNIYSQALSGHKCGQLPNDVELNRSLNWGYGYEDLLSDLSVWGQSPYVTIDSIGPTVENRAIWELTISDNPASNTYKRVYIHARTHPGEEEAFWVVDEIINFLLADTPEAAFIRSQSIFHIVPMHNPDGVELGFPRENANGIDVESGWDDNVLEPEVTVLQNRFIDLSFVIPNPIEVALNMHSAYACKRYFVYHHENGTSENFTELERDFISGIQSYYPGGFEDWSYFVSWTSGTPDQYPESWWWFNYGDNVMALTYEDMNCSQAGNYDYTASAMVRGVCDYIGINLSDIDSELILPEEYSLQQNYPNPFNPSTRINFHLPEDGFVSISILDIKGREIVTILEEEQMAGSKSVNWTAVNKNGDLLPSGVYICLMKTNDLILSKKMILLR